MDAYLECFQPHALEGWATDSTDYSDRIAINVYVDGELFIEATADRGRPDLAHGGRDGNHGFLIGLDLDRFIFMSSRRLQFQARNRDGATRDLTVLPQARSGIALRVPSGDFTMLGSSFLKDNLAEFSGATEDVAEDGAERAFLCFKMPAFMSGAWVEGRDRSDPSAETWLAQLGPKTIDAIRAGELKILFDMSNEGLPFEHGQTCIEALHRGLDARGVDPSHCAIVMQNTAFDASYQAWLRWKGIPRGVHILCYDFYPRRFAAVRRLHVSQQAVDAAIAETFEPLFFVRQHRFLSFNFTPRPHRIAIVSWLLGMDYDKAGLISFRGFNMIKLNARDFQPPEWFPEEKYVILGHKKLLERDTLDLDLADKPTHYIPEFDIGNLELFRQSYFSIVSETDVYSSTQRRITEKILKPFAAFHPFVVFGNPFSLDRLRSMGFKTFHPWIDEDYDLIDEPRQRSHRVMGEIIRLVRMSDNEIADWYRSLLPILHHNYKHLHENLDGLFKNDVEPKVIASLRAMFDANPS